MRELLLLVADKNMQSVFRALFGRDDWQDVLGCAPFEFDVRQDLIYAAGQNDPGIVKRGQEIVRGWFPRP